MSRLEALVQSMEDGQVPLAQLVTRFEEGMGLLLICQQHLREAELKIEQLKTDGGTVRSEPFPHPSPEEP